jgi:multicomponent Na+:H+ antiporter subunit D
MKKFVALMLALVMVLSLGSTAMAAKNKKITDLDIAAVLEDVKSKGKINVYHWWTAGGEKQAIEAIIDGCEDTYAKQDAKSNAIPGRAGGAMVMKVKVLQQAGRSPEAFQAHPGQEIQPYLAADMLYDLTGHLLMSNIKEQIAAIMEAGAYRIPMIVTIGIITVGLAIKSALFPFHSWLPDAYGYATVSSGAILSSLVSKGYIFLLIKIFYRVIGFEHISGSNILNILFLFGLCGMIFGSISAIWEKDIRRMIAFSSVAQIGYIYMGFGLGTEAGMIASIFHILTHAATKSLLFVSAIGLTDVSGGSRSFFEITGAGYRNRFAGAGFLVGALSMVGIPMFSGFVSKLLFAEAAVLVPNWKLLPTLIVLAVSTILNAVYFLKTVVRIYTPVDPAIIREKGYFNLRHNQQMLYCVTIVLFIIVNLILGMTSQPIIRLIEEGLRNFA